MFILILLVLSFPPQDTLMVENWEGGSFSGWHFGVWEVGTAPRLNNYYPPNYDSILNPNHAYYNDFDSPGNSPEIAETLYHVPVAISPDAINLFVYFEYGFRHRNNVNDVFGFYVDFYCASQKITGLYFYRDYSDNGSIEIDLSDFLYNHPDSAKLYWVYFRNDDKLKGWGVAIDSVFAYTINEVVTGIDEEDISNNNVKSIYLSKKELKADLFGKDARIFDLLGRETNELIQGIYFIQINSDIYKTLILR